MKKTLTAIYTTGVIFIAAVGAAGADTLTFDTLATSPSGGMSVQNITEQGFYLNPTSGHLSVFGDGWQNNRGSSNGTTYGSIYKNYSIESSFSLTTTSGELFSIASIDLAEVWKATDYAFEASATSINFIGTKFEGSAIVDQFVFDLISDGSGGANDFQTHVFSTDWTNLVSISLNAFNGDGLFFNSVPSVYYAFDNIVVQNLGSTTPVPEPATMLLLGIGLAGLASSRYTKSQKQ